MKHAITAGVARHAQNTSWELRVPKDAQPGAQDEEAFEVRVKGEYRRMRLHDYDRIFSLPGLYEQLIYKKLKCKTPWRLTSLLRIVMRDHGIDPSSLRVLDLGAGNGIVAERLRRLGVQHVVGADILREAKAAANRDRPGVYDDYLVADFTSLDHQQLKSLKGARFNCLTTAAALGFGDIPPTAFAEALACIETDGWIAVSIKDSFLADSKDTSGFAMLMRRLSREGIVEVCAWQKHHHRLSLAGRPLRYVAIVARKRREMPAELLDGLN